MIKGSFIHTTAEALARDLEVQGPDDCWPWTGQIMKNGYGRLYGNGHHDYVHVAAYCEAKGPIPDGIEIDHLCHTTECAVPPSECPHRRCANPAHLALASHQDNTNRGNSPAAKNRRKTHCKHGHEFTPANTHVRKDGKRNCRRCHRDEVLAAYHRMAS